VIFVGLRGAVGAGGVVVVGSWLLLLSASMCVTCSGHNSFFPPFRLAIGADEREQHVDALMLFTSYGLTWLLQLHWKKSA